MSGKKYNVGFIGLGRLGLPCAIAVNHAGHKVKGYDLRAEVMQKNSFPFKELGPGGEESIVPFLQNSPNLSFGSLKEVVEHAELIFVTVQTPHEHKFEGVTRAPTERIDFDVVWLVAAAKNLNDTLEEVKQHKTIVIISTVNPGTIRPHVLPLLTSSYAHIAYNPLFIAMGTTAPNFLNPEFVLLGRVHEEAAPVVREFYKTFTNAPVHEMSVESAELSKLAYNTFIGMKILFANMLMEISHKTPGCNVDEVTSLLKSATKRIISPSYMTAGMGDGGGCHPRDNIALSWLCQKLGLSFDFFEHAIRARESQTDWMADELLKHAENKELVIFGKSFKPETIIMTGSPSLLLQSVLEERGKKVTMWDPYVDQTEQPSTEGKAIFIGTRHSCFQNVKFAAGSVVIDPFRFISAEKNPGVKIVALGIGK